jgi:predicted O-methyltransferase YrrM
VARAGLASRVKVLVGPALESLKTLSGPFDFAFIDADKTNNANYFDRALALSRPQSVIVVDNVIRDGKVIDASSTDPNIIGTRALFDRISNEPRVDATAIQTVGDKGWDGFLLARVK